MKKTVIYISAIAVLFSCTKENLGNNESFSEVKAEIVQKGTDVKVLIGDKDGDYYPLTWSAGDGIYAMTSTPTSTTEDKYFTSTVNPASAGTQIGYFPYPAGEDITTMIAVHGGTIKKGSKYTYWKPETRSFKVACEVPINQDAFTVPMYAKYVDGSLKFHPAAAIIKFVNIPEGYTSATLDAMTFWFSINSNGDYEQGTISGGSIKPNKSNLNINPYFATYSDSVNKRNFKIFISNGSKKKMYTVNKTLEAGKLYTLDCTKFTDVED